MSLKLKRNRRVVEMSRAVLMELVRRKLRPYTPPMPCRVYVQLKSATRPNVIKDGDKVEVDKKTGELRVKNATGELIGWARFALVASWWIEREVNYQDIEDKKRRE